MKIHQKFMQVSLLTAMLVVVPIQAKAATLSNLLDTIGTGWSQTSFEALSNAGWNSVGQSLDFTLVYENPSKSPWQTFSISEYSGPTGGHEEDGNSFNTLIFDAPDKIGATETHVLAGELFGASFGSNKKGKSYGNDDVKVFVDATGDRLAFVRENTSEHGTFNGMLVSMAVSPVPEPDAWMMLTSGLGVLGFLVYRRRRDD